MKTQWSNYVNCLVYDLAVSALYVYGIVVVAIIITIIIDSIITA